MKKILALLLALMMIVAMFAGCADTTTDESKAEDKSSAADDKKDDAAEDEKPADDEASDEPTLITLFFQDDNVNFPQNMDRPTMQTVDAIAREQFGITLAIETAISSEMESIVNARFASGTDLPDMITYDFAIQRAIELYDQGMILGLNDLIEEHAPELKFRMIEENPALMASHATSDGQIIRVPSCEESIQHEIYVMHIRYDWLTELGLDVPTTPEEFRNVLVAFQENDMNGDGQKDEVFSPGSVQTLNASLSTAFGVPALRLAQTSWYVDDEGKVYNTMITDEAKAYAEYVGSLAKDGLLDLEFTNQTADSLNQKRFNNRVSGLTGAWWDSVILDTQLAEKVPGVEYVPMEPLYDANNTQSILRRTNAGWSCHMFTSSCADPVGLMQLINWCYTKEGTQILYFGEAAPGGDYYEVPTDVPEGLTDYDYQLVYTEKGTAEMAEEPELWAKMGWNQTAFLPQFFESSVGCIALEFYTAFGIEACGRAAEVEFNQNTLNKFINDIGRRELTFASPTAEQIETLAEYADLFIYMDETFQSFLLGNLSMDEWDDYVATCESMGLQDLIDQVFQPRYDAYLEIIS
ncbi:MAG: hypothetical protein E7487_06170 [Ruminococcaceae bacterium]|nr:hypothetical protein [Oscillospiraceae bacterium]